ncbi:MAG: hydrogenase formation protein HypD [Archaeoglobaceae archaeon]|nr:hydrogenase formation protein HypD [Archaeoglobaceae archaeon]MCX8152409.1 hydrogenase formation protein HypD [Archaeoglobaceae archaeon]MDW8013749.1 hydrogenase formation protein HypD [Archaeoglobaceae archaeon]
MFDLKVATDKLFRGNRDLASNVVKILEVLWGKVRKKIDKVKIMNFCGTHEWTTTHHGLRSLLPEGLELVAGPGCPVCITPSYYVEVAIKLALENVKVYTYGDAYKLPAVKKVDGAKSLAEAKSLGGNVSVVYSLLDAVKDARESKRESAFFAIGFETTYPIYASTILKNLPENFTFIICGRLTPPAAEYVVKNVGGIDGVIAPGHVSTIIGGKSWKFLAENYNIPTVVSGFEPMDVLISVVEILRQISESRAEVVIEYTRAVSWEGNVLAKKMILDVFDVCDATWRGIGLIPSSGYRLKEKYMNLDAFNVYGFKEPNSKEWSSDLLPGCRCGEVILGKIKPIDCPLFLKKCTPSAPYGPCMVSLEGTCSIWARFGRR